MSFTVPKRRFQITIFLAPREPKGPFWLVCLEFDKKKVEFRSVVYRRKKTYFVAEDFLFFFRTDGKTPKPLAGGVLVSPLCFECYPA